MVIIRCTECGFDCNFEAAGSVESVVFDYWNHMNDEHGIEYSPETLGRYIKKKLPRQIAS